MTIPWIRRYSEAGMFGTRERPSLALRSFRGKHPSDVSLIAKTGRGDRIRTCDILLPKQARYRTAPLPDLGIFMRFGGPGRTRTRDLAVMSGQL